VEALSYEDMDVVVDLSDGVEGIDGADETGGRDCA